MNNVFIFTFPTGEISGDYGARYTARMSEPAKDLEKTARAITRWVGSPTSIIWHTILFIASFVLAAFGFVPFDHMLLVLTTIVSLEAIYLAIFIQMTINYQAQDIAEVQEDIDEIQEDVEEDNKGSLVESTRGIK